MMLFRRRTPYGQYPVAGPGVGGAPTGVGPGYGPQGYGPTPMGGGIGSGIAGGLASGLAVGAGVVAGEELAHHFLDGGHPTAASFPQPMQPSPATAIATWAATTSAPTIPAPGMTVAVVAAAATTGARPRRPSKNSPFGRLSKAPFLF